jgi:hypothetical protein
MARPCSICGRSDQAAIDSALVAGQSFRHIAAQHGVAPSSLVRHKTEHLPGVLATGAAAEAGDSGTPVPLSVPVPVHAPHAPVLAAQAERQAADELAHALDVVAQLSRQIERLNLLSDACHEDLRDPDDPTRYTLAPPAERVSLVYWGRGPDGKTAKKKTTLQAALDLLCGAGVAVASVDVSKDAPSPSETLMKAAQGLQSQMQLVVQVLDKLHNAQTMERFQAEVLQAIAEVAPNVRERIVAALDERGRVAGVISPAAP